jgi:hypothetical protein
VERIAVMRKLEGMLDEFEKLQAWGNIEIEIREGIPNFIRKSTTEKIAQENTRGGQKSFNR